MRKLRTVLCIVCLILLVPAIMRAQDALPLRSKDLVEKKYDGWTGVLRIWVYEGWKPGGGSLSGWLNRSIAAFEKSHEGVYVQAQYVDISAITALDAPGIHLPDMIVFPPGIYETPAELMPLEDAPAIRDDLSHCGSYQGITYAVPIAMGGYLWAYNTGMLSGIPDTWLDQAAMISAPEDDSFHQWGAALLALCSGQYAIDSDLGGLDLPLGDVDLGLSSIIETPAPTTTPMPDTATLLPCQLPIDFAFSASAYNDFTNGKLAAMPVSQREVRRLEALAAQGKGPDWQLAQAGSAAFSDQVLFMGIIDRADAQDQQSLSRTFMDHLLSEDCQTQLSSASAFSVTGAPSGYASYDRLCAMDAAVRSQGLIASNAFGTNQKNASSEIVRKFTTYQANACDLLPILRDVCH